MHLKLLKTYVSLFNPKTLPPIYLYGTLIHSRFFKYCPNRGAQPNKLTEALAHGRSDAASVRTPAHSLCHAPSPARLTSPTHATTCPRKGIHAP
jgi:hypothetical protein